MPDKKVDHYFYTGERYIAVYEDGTSEPVPEENVVNDSGNTPVWMDEVVVTADRKENKAEQPNWFQNVWQNGDAQKNEQARQSWNKWMPQNYTDYSTPFLFKQLGDTSPGSATPKVLQSKAIAPKFDWQDMSGFSYPVYDGPDYNRDARIKERLYKNIELMPLHGYAPINYQGRATERHIQAYMSVIEDSAQRMEALEKPILYAQQGLSWLSKLLGAGVIVDLGMFWNYFYWVPKLGSDIAEGSELDWMAEQIGLRAAELEEMLVDYNAAYQQYTQGLQALKLALQSDTITLDDGTALTRVEDDDSTLIQMGVLGVAGLSIHKNRNNAKGTYVLYRIVIDGKVYKYGVADAGRRTAAGLPVRLAQQISKLEKIFTPHNVKVEYDILKSIPTTKGIIKGIEDKHVLKNILSKGIPIGNLSHIRTHIGSKIGYLTPRAMELIIKYNSILLKYLK